MLLVLLSFSHVRRRTKFAISGTTKAASLSQEEIESSSTCSLQGCLQRLRYDAPFPFLFKLFPVTFMEREKRKYTQYVMSPYMTMTLGSLGLNHFQTLLMPERWRARTATTMLRSPPKRTRRKLQPRRSRQKNPPKREGLSP